MNRLDYHRNIGAGVAAMKPALLATFAAVPVLALLVAFVLQVQLSVRQGHAARTATAQHEEALWRCNSLPGVQGRADCRMAVLQPSGQPGRAWLKAAT